jgi:predicted NAD/FAD-binding protein
MYNPARGEPLCPARRALPKVAIIGAGIGGAVAAYHLSNSTDAEISVFEASGRIGGRLMEVEIDGRKRELGGSIGIAANKYFVEMTDMLGLLRIPQRQDSGVGFWNGTAFEFAMDGSMTSKLKALLRYCSPRPRRISLAWACVSVWCDLQTGWCTAFSCA